MAQITQKKISTIIILEVFKKQNLVLCQVFVKYYCTNNYVILDLYDCRKAYYTNIGFRIAEKNVSNINNIWLRYNMMT